MTFLFKIATQGVSLCLVHVIYVLECIMMVSTCLKILYLFL
jgi:hypothetical protein